MFCFCFSLEHVLIKHLRQRSSTFNGDFLMLISNYTSILHIVLFLLLHRTKSFAGGKQTVNFLCLHNMALALFHMTFIKTIGSTKYKKN